MFHGGRIATVAAVLLGALATPAGGAGGSCTVDGSTLRVGVLDTTTIARGGTGSAPDDPILVDGAPCAGATVSSTDLIRLGRGGSSAGRVVIALGGGPLAPGATDEPGGSDEIEIDPGGGFAGAADPVGHLRVEGSPGADDVVAGGGINLRGDEVDGVDSDVATQPWQSVLVLGNGGADRLRAIGPGVDRSSAASFAGGAGDDRLVGGSGSDALDGGEGNDRLDGAALGDRLTGGPGDDDLAGGEDTDWLVGGPGADTLDGGPSPSSAANGDIADYGDAQQGVVADLRLGVVTNDGFGGADVIRGVERLFGGRFGDRLTGSLGSDELVGGEGDDVLTGLDGADLLVDIAGDDVLDLGPGNDRSRDGRGDDTVDGGPGDDQISDDDGDDRYDGGDGVDGVRLGERRTVVADLSRDEAVYADGVVEPLVAVESLSADGEGRDVLIGDAGPNFLAAGISGPAPDVVRGRGGDDRLQAGVLDYSDAPAPVTTTDAGLADGEGGVDTSLDPDALVRGSVHDDVIGGHRNVEGGPGNDTITGAAAPGDLSGGTGDDALIGGAQADRLRGGPGSDRLDGAGGNDTADFADALAGVDAHLAAGTVANDGHGDSDVLASIEGAVGSPFGDRLRAAAVATRLDGRAGGDELTGAGADDTLLGGRGADRLTGGSGSDTVRFDDVGVPAGAVLDLASGRARDGWGDTDVVEGIEHAEGSPHGDELSGDERANRLTGAASDVVRGRGGDDVLQGARMLGGPGDDRLGTDFATGVADYAEAPAGIVADLAARTVDDGEGGRDLLGRVVEVSGSPHADQIIGSADFESIRGGAGRDTIDGGAGDDDVDGGPGEDTVRGGSGRDELSMRDGEADRIDCGLDGDTLVADHAGLDSQVACEDVYRSDAPPSAGDQDVGAGDVAEDPVAPGTGDGAPRTSPDAPPAAGGSPGDLGARPPTAPPAADRPPLTLRALPATLRDARGRGLPVQLRCAATCRVRLEMRVTRATAERLRLRGTVLGRATTTAVAGRPRTVRVRLSPSARRALGRSRLRRLDAHVVARAAGRRVRSAAVRLR
jgi:Ca2+-binding RTX toxin-like protein